MTQSQFNTILSNAKALRARYPYMQITESVNAIKHDTKTTYDTILAIVMYDTTLLTITWHGDGCADINLTNGGWCSPTTIKRLNDIVDLLTPVFEMVYFTRSNNVLYHGTTPMAWDLPSNYHSGLGFGYGALSQYLGPDYSFNVKVQTRD